jgi:hypothetical protein
MRNLVVLLIASALAMPAGAQRTVYKSVDEHGVTSFSDEPPDAGKPVEQIVLEIDEPDAAAIAAQQERLAALRESNERMAAERRERERQRAALHVPAPPAPAEAQVQVVNRYYTPYGGYQRPYPPHRPPIHRPPRPHPVVPYRSQAPSKAGRATQHNAQLMRSITETMH